MTAVIKLFSMKSLIQMLDRAPLTVNKTLMEIFPNFKEQYFKHQQMFQIRDSISSELVEKSIEPLKVLNLVLGLNRQCG